MTLGARLKYYREALSAQGVSPRRLLGRKPRPKSVLTLFGTRPEVIKLAPVIHRLEQQAASIRTINVSSGQHAELLYPFIKLFGINVHRDLKLMTVNQAPSKLCARICRELAEIVEEHSPDLILVQGDTTTALAGAYAGWVQGVPVGHIEAGLRSGNSMSPFPEELNRQLITRLATYHFAATAANREALIAEGIDERNIFLTGNPVVDAMQMVLRDGKPFDNKELLAQINGRKCIVLTTHRRESFGKILEENLRVLVEFVEQHQDVVLVFPVHPNPNVTGPAQQICGGHPRVILTTPLLYGDFLALLSRSWLIVSDSGGIQEEVPSLCKPLLIIRENTERAECLATGTARLVGGAHGSLKTMLEEAYRNGSWADSVHQVENPFGDGKSAERIVECIVKLLDASGPAYAA
jgi:UDP-N-acetylglucosamine 2-epimerase (non-hydrolysing)